MHQQRLIFSGYFTLKNITYVLLLGLSTVLKSMYEMGKALLKSDITDLSPDQTWGQWGLAVTYRSSGWLWSRLVTGINDDTEYVFKEVLEVWSSNTIIVDFNYDN